jgi:hypothetical protein
MARAVSQKLLMFASPDYDDDDDSQDEDKPTHGFAPTFWSQLRLEKLEEVRFPVKLVSSPSFATNVPLPYLTPLALPLSARVRVHVRVVRHVLAL